MTYHMQLWHSDLALNGRPEQHRKPGHRFCLQCNDKIKRIDEKLAVILLFQKRSIRPDLKLYEYINNFPRCKTKTPFQINFASNTDSMKRQFCFACRSIIKAMKIQHVLPNTGLCRILIIICTVDIKNDSIHKPGCPSPTDSEVKRNVVSLEPQFILRSSCKQMRKSACTTKRLK